MEAWDRKASQFAKGIEVKACAFQGISRPPLQVQKHNLPIPAEHLLGQMVTFTPHHHVVIVVVAVAMAMVLVMAMVKVIVIVIVIL